MARPDISAERIEQILDSFENCIASSGLEGTTLEMVAQQAGVKRSLIRHYIGNRDQVLLAWAQRSIARYHESLQELVDALPRRNRARKLVEYLFLESSNDGNAELVMDLLIANSEKYDECRVLISAFIEDMVGIICSELQQCFEQARPQRCFEVASAVVAVSLCADSLAPLRLPRKYRKAWQAMAKKMVEELAD